MASIGIQNLGTPLRSGYSVLANNDAMSYHPIAVTIDASGITAETVARTLVSGNPTTPGDKVLPAGTVLRKVTAGAINSKWQVAASGDTPARGDCVILEKDWFFNTDLNQVGPCIDNGNVIAARVLMGNTGQIARSAVEAALPGVRFFQ
jgi:hypothetical protein